MIAHWGQREQTGGFPRDLVTDFPPRREVSVGKAMSLLVEGELGFGGTVTDLKIENEIATVEVQTRVLYKLDTTWFQGSVKEMEPLLLVVAYHAQLLSTHRSEFIGLAVQKMKAMQGGKDTFNPFEVATFGPVLFGGLSAKAAMVSAMGVRSEPELKTLLAYSIPDLCAAWELNSYRADGMIYLLGEAS